MMTWWSVLKEQPRAIRAGQWITRKLLNSSPDKLFLFGDNHKRYGKGGQARVMRGHPNAHGIRTKHAPSMHQSAMWTDDTYENNVRMIDEDLDAALETGKQLVIPDAGLGTGLSRLPQNAPRTNEYLESRLHELLGEEDG